ncbi:hypothetical protein SUDANB95_00725 [Actinosynnema sp. ALI-1.44]
MAGAAGAWAAGATGAGAAGAGFGAGFGACGFGPGTGRGPGLPTGAAGFASVLDSDGAAGAWGFGGAGRAPDGLGFASDFAA